MADYAAEIARIVPDLSYSAEFVPFSCSRNAHESRPSLNWKITLTTPRGKLTTDYMQGVGHLPGDACGFRTVHNSEYERFACEYGKWGGYDRHPLGSARLPRPALTDILSSLLSDAEALDYASFDQWADDLGFDADSRKAEAIYRACLDIGLSLRRMIGDVAITELRESLRDL